MSHEFRTLLTLMLGPVEALLAKSDSLPAEDREQLVMAHRNSLRLLKLVNCLLDFSRIEAGRVRTSYVAVDLAALTADLASSFRSAMEAVGLELEVDCPPLPEPVYVDREMWEKIVLNLLSNAFKFTFKGRVSVQLRALGPQVQLTVADTGTGIPEAEMPNLFKRFHRVEGAKGRTFEGPGIGLALIQDLVKLHGGTVEVKSHTDVGSAFTVTLSFGSAHLPQEFIGAPNLSQVSTAVRGEAFTAEAQTWTASAQPADLPVEVPQGTRPRILLADDNADMREHIGHILGTQYEFVAVVNGEVALAEARRARPDLILSDVMMPGLDGFGVLHELRADPSLREVPVILVSARAGEEARTEGIAAGADDYVTKPFSAKELSARVRTAIELHKIRREAREQIQRSEAALEAEPVDLKLLQEVSAALVNPGDPGIVYQKIVDAAVLVMGSEFASLQTFHPERRGGELRLTAFHGFTPEAARFWEWVRPDSQSTCGVALNTGERVIVPDVDECDFMEGTQDLAAYRQTGIVAVQTTPLISRGGRPLGMISTHWKKKYQPSERQLHLLDIIVRQAADLFERKEAEEAINYRSQQFRTLLDKAPLGVYLVDADFRLAEVNPTALPKFGEIDGLIGRDLEEVLRILWSADYASEAMRLFRHTLETGESYAAPENIEPRIDGQGTEYFEYQFHRILLPDGRIGVVCYFRDISAHVKSREAIQRLNAELSSDLAAMTRLQQLSTRIIQADELNTLLGEIMSAAIEITRADMANIQLFQNGRFQIVQQHGFQAPFLEFFHEVAQGSAVWGVALERHERVIVEDVAHSPIFTGHEAAREAVLAAGARAVQSTPLISRSGQLLGMLSTHYFKPQQLEASDLRRLDLLSRLAADVIERRSNHESLRISEERVRELADNISQFAWMTDATGSIFWYNQRWYDYTGTALDEMQGWGWQKVLHPDHADRVVERFRHAIEHEELWEDTFPLRGASGEWRWFLSRALPIRDSHGLIERWFGTNTDVTEQRETEEKLRHANSDLEQFAYSASHDLQEPLRSVRIYSELLEERYQDGLDGEALEFLGFLKSGASRMQSLIHDLLAYTQVTVADLANADADSQEALHAALTNLSAAIAHSQARVTWDPLPRLPVHRLHLQQLFQNLVGNAIKYRRQNEPPQVHVKAERQNANWLFSVQDNGSSIDPEYKERIFGLFKRLHPEDEYSGTGIGLAICQRIVERYHGHIWIESQLGVGSTFYFTVPVVEKV